jgi:predicted transcriptional regulator of viral defense system
MKMVQAISSLADHTAGQWGLVTAAQAKTTGVDSVTLLRLVDAGLLTRIRHGVYQLTASEESAHLAEKAAWLALRPATPGWQRPKLDPDGGVLSHRSAALLHELGDLVTERIEITVPRRRATRDREVQLRERTLSEDEVTLVDGLPVTTVERTVVDLLDDHVDASHIGQILHEASRQDRLDLKTLAERVGRFCRRYGVKGRHGHALIEHLLATVRTEPSRTEQSPVARLLWGTGASPGSDAVARLMRSQLDLPQVRAALADANLTAHLDRMTSVRAVIDNLTKHSGMSSSLQAQAAAFRAATEPGAAPHEAFRAFTDLEPQLKRAGGDEHEQQAIQGNEDR